MPVDLAGFRDSFFGQVIIALTIVAVCAMLGGFLTESWIGALVTGVGSILVVVVILILQNVNPIAEWIKNAMYNTGGVIISPLDAYRKLMVNGFIWRL